MKNYKVIAIFSLVINLVLGVLLFKPSSSKTTKYSTGDTLAKEKDLSVRYNFEKIFLEKNDSVYREVFNKSFEDLPVQAYLLACTYYLLKKDTITKKDIEMISSEIKGIYGRAPNIDSLK
jgi:hypothetical protein